MGLRKPPIEKEVDIDGRRIRVRVEAVEAGVERGIKEHVVARVRAVVEDGREAAVEKEAGLYKVRGNAVQGYVNIHVGAEGGREADYVRATVLKVLGIEKWKLLREGEKPKQIQLTGGSLDALMRLEPVCGALGICQAGRLS